MPYRFPCPDCDVDIVTYKRKGELAWCAKCGVERRVPDTAEGRVPPSPAGTASSGEDGLSCLVPIAVEALLVVAAVLLSPPGWVLLLFLLAMAGIGVLILWSEARRRRRRRQKWRSHRGDAP